MSASASPLDPRISRIVRAIAGMTSADRLILEHALAEAAHPEPSQADVQSMVAAWLGNLVPVAAQQIDAMSVEARIRGIPPVDLLFDPKIRLHGVEDGSDPRLSLMIRGVPTALDRKFGVGCIGTLGVDLFEPGAAALLACRSGRVEPSLSN